MLKLPENKVVMVDVDDTLVMWDKEESFNGDLVEVCCRGHKDLLVPHTKNIDLLKRYARRGYTVVVWSAGGSDWAEAVIEALTLQSFVKIIMPKPAYYIDDLRCQDWMGTWVNSIG